MTTEQKLREALQDAATSLETLSQLAGKPVYPNGDITCMGTFADVRTYAANRAYMARVALALPTTEAQDHIPDAGEMVGAELPPLPEPKHRGIESAGSYFDSYTAAQMQAYARASLSAQAVPDERDKDAERLDWLGSSPACAITEDSGVWFFNGHGYQSLRASIDAAIAAQGGQ